ncbi:hypothetical protein [Vreelandella titanicae]|uniref:hypothetical protein n=1 Tax=Vreelandella titanicae TaxID=664683 RepID=UPI001681AFDF|nr:hypothetical protein [Halomonas titanicae]QNU63676.1 hypothetical protein HZS52_04790 [Halomonas titanicae]
MTPPFGWIEMSNHAQLEWIAAYLARQSLGGSLPDLLMQNLNQYGSQQVVNMLGEAPNNAEFRELSGKMKGAWKTRQNRKKYGNPVSLQMPKASMKQLKALAKKRKQSQVQTLSQIISKAADDQTGRLWQREKEQELLPISQRSDDHYEPLLYSSVESKLLDFLADEIDSRCTLEVRRVNTPGLSMSGTSKKAYLDLVERRLQEIEKEGKGVVPQLRARMEKRAQRNSLVYLDDEIPKDII